MESLETRTLLAIAVGDVAFKGSWSNVGSGRMRNYAELDVYRSSDPTTPIWVETLSGYVGPGRTVRGEFRNENPLDRFSERWRPTTPGVYIVRVYADPENAAMESNELNNRLEFKIKIRGPRGILEHPWGESAEKAGGRNDSEDHDQGDWRVPWRGGHGRSIDSVGKESEPVLNGQSRENSRRQDEQERRRSSLDDVFANSGWLDGSPLSEWLAEDR